MDKLKERNAKISLRNVGIMEALGVDIIVYGTFPEIFLYQHHNPMLGCHG